VRTFPEKMFLFMTRPVMGDRLIDGVWSHECPVLGFR
jgi:hypothetical protein